MSTSGLNPTGTLCFGANNTTSVSIGFDDAITIDNTTAEITINGTIYNGSGTQTDFTSLILSNAGFNPSGSLSIGTSNTSEITIGALKIDNTVLPPQFYMNGVALPPNGIALPPDDTFELVSDAMGDNDNIANNVVFIKTVNNNLNLLVDTIKQNTITITQNGIYEFTFNLSVFNYPTYNGQTISFRLVAASEGFYIDNTNNLPLANGDPFPGSESIVTFNESLDPLIASKTFIVYVGSDSGVDLTIEPQAPPSLNLRINKSGTTISIKRTGDYTPPPP